MQIWSVTHQGKVRKQNEDSHAFFQPEPSRCFALVCDGMGGAKAGEVASRLAVERISTLLKQTEDWSGDPEQLLRKCCSEANRTVFLRASTDRECEGMGTTLVAAMVLGEQAWILNVGDSRAYHISEKDGIRRITRDHSVVEDMVERGEISPEEARLHPQKNLITRVLGTDPSTGGDLYQVSLEASDFLLLCSDGLSNLLDDEEIACEVLHGGTPEDCCQRLLQIVLDRGAPDNVTAVLLSR